MSNLINEFNISWVIFGYLIRRSLPNNNPAWSGLNSASADIVSDGDSYMTLLTPWLAPWVSNDIVFSSVLNTITDGNNSVVKVCTTVLLEDSTSVISENSTGINGDRDWTSGKSSLELGWVHGWDIVVFTNIGLNFCLVVHTDTVSSCVFVISQKFKTHILNILEGIFVVASITSLISVWETTVNLLLFWKLKKYSSLDGVMSFNNCSWGKWPAWAALLLVLHWVKFSKISPINRLWEISLL